MDELKELLYTNHQFDDLQIMLVFKKIGEIGDIILFKYDGLRTDNHFTVVITSPSEKFESIRFDANDLSSAVIKALTKYIL